MYLRRKKNGKCKVLSGGFVYVIQKPSRGITILAIFYCSNENSYPAPESSKQNPPDRTLDLPFFFHYEHITSLKNLPSPTSGESLPHWLQDNFAAMFALNYRLREFTLSAFAIALN